jgi:hypothetical protein
MQYGQTNLIVPGGMTISSLSMIDERKGIVLEWGIRSRKVKPDKNKISAIEQELYIEITKFIQQ